MYHLRCASAFVLRPNALRVTIKNENVAGVNKVYRATNQQLDTCPLNVMMVTQLACGSEVNKPSAPATTKNLCQPIPPAEPAKPVCQTPAVKCDCAEAAPKKRKKKSVLFPLLLRIVAFCGKTVLAAGAVLMTAQMGVWRGPMHPTKNMFETVKEDTQICLDNCLGLRLP